MPLAPNGLERFSDTEAEERDDLITSMLDEIRLASDARTADVLESALSELWLASGSPTVDLLMSWGIDALEADQLDRALAYFDEVVALAPTYPEGWHKRSAVHYLLDDYGSALNDLEHVLLLEPRHFPALAGMAVMLEEVGERQGALKLLRRARELNPHLDQIDERIDALQVEVEGRGI